MPVCIDTVNNICVDITRMLTMANTVPSGAHRHANDTQMEEADALPDGIMASPSLARIVSIAARHGCGWPLHPDCSSEPHLSLLCLLQFELHALGIVTSL